MLREWVESLLTPTPAHGRTLGYLHEIIAIGARHRRCRDAWAAHLANSRRTVIEAIGRARGRRTVLVLGSGRLLDVPLAELAAAFARVVLADAVHPLAARWQARRHGNVELMPADVTGALEALRHGDVFPVPKPFAPLRAPEVDLVISLNLLSQVGVLPEEWLRRRGPAMAARAAELGAVLTRAHLDDLANAPAPVCLISDVEWQHVDKRGQVVERGSTIFDVPPPPAAAEWLWDIAPAPEAHPTLDEQRRVIVAWNPGKPQAAG